MSRNFEDFDEKNIETAKMLINDSEKIKIDEKTNESSSGNTIVCGTSDRISCEEHPVRRTVMRIPANIFFISRILFPLHTLLFSDQFLPNSVSTSPLLRSRVIPILQEFTNRSKGLPFISLTFFISEVPDSLARSISSLFSIQRICS